MTEEISWTGIAWIVLAAGSSFGAMYIKAKADFDRLTKEPKWLPEARRIGFFVAASLLLFSCVAVFSGLNPPLIYLLLLASCTYLIATNAYSASFRETPKGGSRSLNSSRRSAVRHIADYGYSNFKRQDKEDRST